MLISELMTTALITGDPGDLVDETLFHMKMASIRHLPVVTSKGHLVGIVSDRDVLLSLGLGEEQNIYLRDIMTKSVVVISESADAAQALALMLELKIGALPVVGDERQLVGVVTETDFLEVARMWLSGSVSSDGHANWRL